MITPFSLRFSEVSLIVSIPSISRYPMWENESTMVIRFSMRSRWWMFFS